jgi:hypothetical protein
MKIKCVKLQWPVCGKTGSCQLFLNRNNKITYAKVRHYSHIDKQTKKLQFEYHKIMDLEALKTLLLNKGFSLSTSNVLSGQIGQKSTTEIHDQKLKDLKPVYKKQDSNMGRSSSLVRTLALRAKGRRFKSGSAHHLLFLLVESDLFGELHCENWVNRCFKWFSIVLLRLKPNSLDFAINSLSKYNTTFLLFLIANASEGKRRDILCYMSGHF